MTTTVSDILSKSNLRRRIDGGYISERRHPEFPELAIYNYSPKAAYEQAWDNETLRCRGLIADTETDEILARPPAKFFNHGQDGAPSIPLHASLTVMDKLDGSLAIPYTCPDGSVRVATRGSFESDQAKHATDIWQRKHAGFGLPRGFTLYFEFIAKWNRIVLDYGDLEDLVLLGAVSNGSGSILSAAEARNKFSWTGLFAEEYLFGSLDELLSAPPRDNAEGYVIKWGDGGMLKVKQQDYLELHRAKFHTTPRSVHAALAGGADREALVASVPDEFHGKVKAIVDDLVREFLGLYGRISAEYAKVRHIEDQKEYAMAVKQLDHTPALFSIKSGRDIDDYVWKLVRPSGPEALSPLAD